MEYEITVKDLPNLVVHSPNPLEAAVFYPAQRSCSPCPHPVYILWRNKTSDKTT